jgi:hypothetical protein
VNLEDIPAADDIAGGELPQLNAVDGAKLQGVELD